MRFLRAAVSSGRATVILAAAASLMLAHPPHAGAKATPRLPAAHGAQCTTSVAFALVQASGSCLEQVSSTQYTSSATVTINGIALTPVSGTVITLTTPSSASPGGSIGVQLAMPLSAGGISWLAAGLINWNLPAGGPGTEAAVASTGTLNGQKLLGFDVNGSAQIRLGCTAATPSVCYWKFVANLALPSIFKNGPGRDAGGLTATVGLQVDANGVHADAVQATVANAYVGSLQIKNLCLSYVAAGSSTVTPCTPPPYMGESQYLQCSSPGNVSRWDGSALVVLPTASRPSVGVYAGVQNGLFSYAGLQVGGLGNSLPIAQGIFLDSFRLALCVTPEPVTFRGGAGINIGPSVNGKAPVTINGDLAYTDSRPWVLEATGNALVEGDPVASGFLRYTSTNAIDFGFDANFGWSVASVRASVRGWVQAAASPSFNVDGSGSVCVSSIACTGGEVTVSSSGVAGCFTLLNFRYPVPVKNSDWAWYAPWRVHIEYRSKRVRAGVGYVWATKKVNLMGDSCDVGPSRTIRTARAADAARTPFTVSGRPAALSLQISGSAAGAAPRIVLTNPAGVTFTEPASGALVARGLVFAPDAAQQTTAVEIADPQAGTWYAEALGGDTISGIEQAAIDPEPTIVAAVGEPGSNPYQRTLGYSYTPDPVHTITFFERGPDYEQELGEAASTACQGDSNLNPTPDCGSIPFIPDATPQGGPHEIIALVTDDDTGETTEQIPVASYDSPPEVEPSAVIALGATRSGSSVTISWGVSVRLEPGSVPIAYNVDVATSTGEKLLDVVPAGTLSDTIPNIDPSTSVEITVRPMREDDTQGPPAQVTLPAGQSSTA